MFCFGTSHGIGRPRVTLNATCSRQLHIPGTSASDSQALLPRGCVRKASDLPELHLIHRENETRTLLSVKTGFSEVIGLRGMMGLNEADDCDFGKWLLGVSE